MCHPVQRCPLEKEFRRLLRKGSCAQRRAKDRLTAKEGRLGQTAAMIPRLLLPPPPAQTPNRPQVFIALPGGTPALAMLPNLGVPPRRNDRLGTALGQRVVAVPLVIGPVATDLANCPFHVRH